ncbi:sugar nucleotide-binding protein [Actomonas aquatica]|uniref:dTDP-4-dehydrorhamnose reductase n=1 Tax=Actomonas aquatica TaxID=2866162 RepID=A0ABZ1CA42_9BACT|nr:sugar nucleotide-binding protein [Opitutus sp. WL0086]WRQ88525.1 sugar nucleotide-binding protein [Opitutus sp. WL0086]
MIYLLGGSGYVGQAYQDLLTRKNIPFKNLRRADVDYTDVATLTAALQADRPEFLINAAGYTGKPNVDACEQDKAECLFGNAVLPGRIAAACAAAGVPWGHVSSGCIYTGKNADGSGFTEDDAPNFSFRTNNCSYYSGTKALGEENLAGIDNVYIWRLRIPFDHRDNPRNYLTKLMRYQRLLEAENSISHLHEFVAATFACWEKRIPFGTYNVTNPGYITTRQVVDLIKESGVCTKDFEFFSDESEFMAKAAKTPRSNCVMDSTKLAQAGITMTPVIESLRQALADWVLAAQG